MTTVIPLIKEVVQYLRKGRYDFRIQADIGEKRAEKAYQGSMTSAMEVTREAARVRTNVGFIREILSDHG